MGLKRILFIDRDGTLIKEPHDEQVDAIEKIEFLEGVIPALLCLKEDGYRFVMVTNQDGLGTDSFPKRNFDLSHDFMMKVFEGQGITFDDVLICPHFPEDNCLCRKPKIGLVLDYLSDPKICRRHSAVIGDRESDLQLARNMNLKGIQIGKDDMDWRRIQLDLSGANREANIERKTRETYIQSYVDLDRADESKVVTGIPFFDHMLEQLPKHGGFTLNLKAEGDLEVDEHHTVEDVAIVLGETIKKALGDKVNLNRYGFVLPMDEARAEVSIDLSGRSMFVFEGELPREVIGGIHTEMFTHFFQSFSFALGATIHIKVIGSNTHHKVEAMFKGMARALKQAVYRTENSGLPSTKGAL